MLTLKASSDFQRVRRDGRSWTHPLIVLTACRNQLTVTRVGVAAGKSVGNAVRRNRAKRRLRAALRQHEGTVAGGWDVTLIARAALPDAPWHEVQAALALLLKRARIASET